MSRLLLVSVVVTLTLLASGCATAPAASATPQPAAAPQPFSLTSSAFAANQPIPLHYSCAEKNLSPPLAWSNPPAGTGSFALTLEDPDAVAVVGYVYDHWLLFNLPASATALPEGIQQGGDLPDGSRQGKNSSGQQGYGGPCPPGGQTHKYVFTLYAVDKLLDLKAGVDKKAILKGMEGHILGQAQLVGMFKR